MDDENTRWIEFTTPDGRTSRMRVDQIGMVTRANGDDTGVIRTSLGELIRVLNVTHVLKQWRHRLLFVVSRRATNHHRYLRRAFADVDWAEVIFDRRRRERRQQQCPWMVDRRTTGRRTRPEVDERVRTFGWAIVRLRQEVTATPPRPAPAPRDAPA
jgi:hypothetical protein